MFERCDILLTGATGFLGRYLLGELLARGHRVAVLVRDAGTTAATDRVDEVTAFCAERSGGRLEPPILLAGDLRSPGLGLSPTERGWLARHRPAVVHAAAQVAFRKSDDGEPWATNLHGTRRLSELCGALGLNVFHHVSTAFVCGAGQGSVREDDLDRGQLFHNEYEHSKFEAERLVRSARHLRTTVYRPSVIVGDSRTGRAGAYHGLYHILALADLLAGPVVFGQRRQLPLRLPFTGAELRDLVTVDWVAQAIACLIEQPHRHGETYHLTAQEPVSMATIKEAAEEVLGLTGVSWVGHDGLTSPSLVEQSFLELVQIYWPYLSGDPQFDQRTTRAALPDLPPPRIDREMLCRLIRSAHADNWGRRARRRAVPTSLDCADYLQRFLPEAARRSGLAQSLRLNLTVGFDVQGPGGGQWSCHWEDGELLGVTRRLEESAAIVYGADVPTFEAIVCGRDTPQEAFFSRRINIKGDLEKGLKLAVLFAQFVQDFPYLSTPLEEAMDGAACPG